MNTNEKIKLKELWPEKMDKLAAEIAAKFYLIEYEQKESNSF